MAGSIDLRISESFESCFNNQRIQSWIFWIFYLNLYCALHTHDLPSYCLPTAIFRNPTLFHNRVADVPSSSLSPWVLFQTELIQLSLKTPAIWKAYESVLITVSGSDIDSDLWSFCPCLNFYSVLRECVNLLPPLARLIIFSCTYCTVIFPE